MKHIKLYINGKHTPTAVVEAVDGVLMKHQLANLILQYIDINTVITKIRVVIE